MRRRRIKARRIKARGRRIKARGRRIKARGRRIKAPPPHFYECIVTKSKPNEHGISLSVCGDCQRTCGIPNKGEAAKREHRSAYAKSITFFTIHHMPHVYKVPVYKKKGRRCNGI